MQKNYNIESNISKSGGVIQNMMSNFTHARY